MNIVVVRGVVGLGDDAVDGWIENRPVHSLVGIGMCGILGRLVG